MSDVYEEPIAYALVKISSPGTARIFERAPDRDEAIESIMQDEITKRLDLYGIECLAVEMTDNPTGFILQALREEFPLAALEMIEREKIDCSIGGPLQKAIDHFTVACYNLKPEEPDGWREVDRLRGEIVKIASGKPDLKMSIDHSNPLRLIPHKQEES